MSTVLEKDIYRKPQYSIDEWNLWSPMEVGHKKTTIAQEGWHNKLQHVSPHGDHQAVQELVSVLLHVNAAMHIQIKHKKAASVQNPENTKKGEMPTSACWWKSTAISPFKVMIFC